MPGNSASDRNGDQITLKDLLVGTAGFLLGFLFFGGVVSNSVFIGFTFGLISGIIAWGIGTNSGKQYLKSFDDLPPGDPALYPCRKCGQDKMARKSTGIFNNEYQCDFCGYKSDKKESLKPFFERASDYGDNDSEREPEISLQDMKLAPELKDDEELLFSCSYPEGGYNNAVLAVTNTRLFTRPKKRTKIKGNLEAEDIVRDISLENVQAIRQERAVTSGEIEVETESELVLFDGLNTSDMNTISAAIVDTEELNPQRSQNNNGEDSFKTGENVLRASLGLSGAVITVVGVFLGLSFLALGLALSLSIIGIIFGAPFMFIGVLMMALSIYVGIMGAGATAGISSGVTEWLRREDGEPEGQEGRADSNQQFGGEKDRQFGNEGNSIEEDDERQEALLVDGFYHKRIESENYDDGVIEVTDGKRTGRFEINDGTIKTTSSMYERKHGSAWVREAKSYLEQSYVNNEK